MPMADIRNQFMLYERVRVRRGFSEEELHEGVVSKFSNRGSVRSCGNGMGLQIEPRSSEVALINSAEGF